jgi:uncharacterized membrane protein
LVAVASIRETVDIEAPIDRVWAVVHEDFGNAQKWSSNLDRVEVLTDGPLGKGSQLRYVLNTPGGKQQLDVEHTTVTPGKTCSGKFIKGPVKGTWKYAYSDREGHTRLVYTMEYEPNGFAARLFFGVIERQLPNDVAKTLASLKKYAESGKGPRLKAKSKK